MNPSKTVGRNYLRASITASLFKKEDNLFLTGNRKPKTENCLFLCLLVSLLLTGCAAGPDFVRPQPPEVTQYTQGQEPTQTIAAGGQAQQFEPGADIAADWWQVFKSPQLDGIVKEAVAQNRNLAAAQARLRQSQELLQAGYGVFYPQANFGFSAIRQKFSPVQFGSALSGSTFNLYTPSANVSYLLDVFGGQRRAVEDLAAQVDYQGYTAQATYITLMGNVINAASPRPPTGLRSTPPNTSSG